MPELPYAIGIDVGGTNIRAARISALGAVLEKQIVASSREPAEALEIIKKLAAQMGAAEARAIGIGIPGRVDGLTGEILSGGYVDLSSFDLRALMAQAFNLKVVVANDCSMALIAEARCGAVQGMRHAAMLTVGTGIGGALMENGTIVNGKRCAGQLGHLIVVDGGQPCACGQRGCVESESSGPALRRHMNDAGYGPDERFEQLHMLAEAGDEKALRVLRNWAAPMRAAIRTLSAAVDPEVVVLGGGLGEATFKALGFLPEVRSWYDIDVRPALLGDDAGIIGAGLAAFDALAPVMGKQLVMVNGVPASGKSTVALALAEKTGWPVLSIDTIKNPHLELFENVDREFNRLLGRASYKAIFSIIRDAPPGSTFIVDAWFGFQPINTLKQHAQMAGITRIAELWCQAPPAVVAERYTKRSSARLHGHPGPEYAAELVKLAENAEPARLGPVISIDTTQPYDLGRIRNFLTGFNR